MRWPFNVFVDFNWKRARIEEVEDEGDNCVGMYVDSHSKTAGALGHPSATADTSEAFS